MTNLIFLLDKLTKICIKIPDIPEKFNYYYEPTEHLHKFDEATTLFIKDNKQLQLQKDVLQEAILPLFLNLKKAIAYESSLPEGINPGDVGEELNKSYNERPHTEVSSFSVWQSVRKKTCTLLYNFNDSIYLEIIPLYKWSYIEPRKNEKYITFDEFLKTYKPYYVEVIPHDVALTWQKQCIEIIKKTGIDKSYSITE